MPTPDEVKFIRWWSTNPTGFSGWEAYRDALGLFNRGLVQVSVGRDRCDCFTLTPRGADLIATADAVGFDPDAETVVPEPVVCGECGGTKRVPVLGTFTNPCPSCSAPIRPPVISVNNIKIDMIAADVAEKLSERIRAALTRPPSTFTGTLIFGQVMPVYEPVSYELPGIFSHPAAIVIDDLMSKLHYEAREKGESIVFNPHRPPAKIDTNPPGLGED